MTIRRRWIALVHAAATGTRRTRTLLTPIGVLIFGTFTALFVVAALTVDRALQLPGLLPEGARWWVGTPLLVVGGAVTLWSALHFLKVRGSPVPFNPPPRLVTTGPYRWTRNPMLTGVFLLLFGIGFGLGSMSLVLLFTPLYVVANVWELKQVEEPELVERLGEEYVEYRRRTPMFLPRLGRRLAPGREP